MTCDPNTLSILSSPLRSLTEQQLFITRTYLLCQWANRAGSAAPNAPTNPDITPDSGTPNITVTWTNPATPGTTNEVWRSTDGGTIYTLFSTVAGGVSTVADHGVQPANSIWYYKIRACNGTSCSAFTNPAGIAHSFTSPNVAAISLPFVVQSSGNFNATGLALLTSVSLPKLHSSLGNINISANPNLTSISLPVLSTVGLSLLLGANNLTGALSLPALVSTSSDVQAQSNPLMTSFSAPLLTSVGGNFTVASSGITTISVNSLATIGLTLQLQACAALTSISFPALTSVTGDTTFENCTALTSASFPVLVTAIANNIYDMRGDGCTILSSLSVPQVVWNNDTIEFSTDALNAASINQILARGVASGVTVCTFNLAGGTNAAPSGQGIADKATLIGLGNAVNTN